jgi:hypothetical protein
MTRISILLIAAATLVSCSKKEDGAAGGAPASGGTSTGGGDKGKAVKLDKLGLTLDIRGDAAVSVGQSENSVMITGPGIGAMQVSLMKAPVAAAAAVDDAKMYSPKNETTELIPPSDWLMTFENAGAVSTNYWVDSQRTINGKPYKCGTTGSDPAQAKEVKFACKSLR